MVLTPIASTPPEILCYIFALTLISKTATPPSIPAIGRGPSWYCKSGILGGPWIFGQVCSYWRKLAESTPTLWTSITVSHSLMPSQLRLLDTHLARSGNAPLDVLIHISKPRLYHDTSFKSFLAKIVAQSTRWRTLRLELLLNHFPHAVFTALASTAGALPLLEELVFNGGGPIFRIASDWDTMPEEKIKEITFFEDAPVLRRVAVSGYVSNQLDISLPWGQLTAYKGSVYGLTTKLDVGQNLVECELTGRYFDDADKNRVHTLPYLRRLVLTDVELLHTLATPALQSLYIKQSIYIKKSVSGLIHLLHRSGCITSLVELTLVFCNTPAGEIIVILKQLPSLAALSLDICTPPAPIVTALMAAERLCPNLMSLSWADREDALDRAAFADMVASRCSASSAVQTLRFVAVYSGRRRMKGAGWRMRGIQGLEVVTMNRKKGAPACGFESQKLGNSTFRSTCLPVFQLSPLHHALARGLEPTTQCACAVLAHPASLDLGSLTTQRCGDVLSLSRPEAHAHRQPASIARRIRPRPMGYTRLRPSARRLRSIYTSDLRAWAHVASSAVLLVRPRRPARSRRRVVPSRGRPFLCTPPCLCLVLDSTTPLAPEIPRTPYNIRLSRAPFISIATHRSSSLPAPFLLRVCMVRYRLADDPRRPDPPMPIMWRPTPPCPALPDSVHGLIDTRLTTLLARA
ncbi:hypothetical protein DFH06DRAFT_1347753 [Mycena polygramma]|nr:hypothetical protein DFH06DRAFT_1347753 [Mycena polygramma]